MYLDHAATTAPHREVLEAMWPWLTTHFGNASSHHERGRRAALALEDARERLATVLGARPGEIVFTSGGTEADNLAVKGIALARRERHAQRSHVLVSAIEHDAVLESARDLAREGFIASELPVSSSGFLSPEAFRTALESDDAAPPTSPEATSSGTPSPGGPPPDKPPATSRAGSVALASVMLANNEVGTVQDIPALAAVAAEHGVPLHTDAVQAGGVLELDVTELGVSALSLAGHKIGTPPGIGLLWLKRGTPLRPLLSGGGHERGRRSGTSNVAGAVGLAVALELAERERLEYARRCTLLRDRLITGILESVPGTVLTGPDPRVERSGGEHLASGIPGRLATNASFCFPGVNGEAVLVDLENREVLVSSGSACAAGSTEPSHVLTALGIPPELASTAVRYSLGRDTTEEGIGAVVRATAHVVATLRREDPRPEHTS